MNDASLHEGLLALMAAAITASVFTIGFSSARHHHALRQLRQAERDGEPYPARLLEDEAADLVMWGNAALWALVILAALVAGLVFDDSIGWEEGLTLVGFALVETIIVVLGWRDHQRTQKSACSAHAGAVDRRAAKARRQPKKPPGSGPPES